MRLIDDLFGMGDGYVLNFSNKTFAEFFYDELEINIDEPLYEVEGTSKAKRLRYFLRNAEPELRIKTLLALWEYREADRKRSGADETYPGAKEEFKSLIKRLGGKNPSASTNKRYTESIEKLDPTISNTLKSKLIELNGLQPHPRGFAFEKFLKELFEVNGLAPRASFKLIGEQIDGSFELSAETYLIEAKWTNSPVGVSDLHTFQGKLEQKAAWSRGLFISESGFSDDGLIAFGKGKRVVCMDGLDLYEMLDKNISFGDIVAKKVRRAAESGNPFVRVRDLYT